MILDLIRWDNDLCIVFGICVRSTLKVDKMRLQLFLLPECRRPSVTLSRPGAAEISQAVLRQWRETSQHEHHLLRVLGMQTAKDRWQRETSGDVRINNQEMQLSKERTKRQTKNLFDCKNCRSRRNPQDRGIPSDKVYKRQRWKAQQTLRRSGQDDQCWRWTITSKNQSRKQGSADQRNKYFQERRKLGHWCESAKHEQPWDVDLGKWVHRRSSKLSSDSGNQCCHSDRKS